MLRFCLLLSTFAVLAPAVRAQPAASPQTAASARPEVSTKPQVFAQPQDSAQPASDSALVAQIYEDLARRTISPVVAVLDDHVLWIEGAHSRQVGRHIGPGTVATRVLQPQVASGIADAPDSIMMDLDRVVAVGTTRRIDPSTGRLIVARFRHVWRVIDRRVVSVHRSDDGPDREDAARCDLATC